MAPKKRDPDAVMQRMSDRMARRCEQAIANEPDFPTRLMALAESLSGEGYPVQALGFCRKALALGNPQVGAAARRLLTRLVPGYHLPMMNDRRRNKAWDEAFRRAIRPGMKVLEIGTGAGMLAMMAARAGAEKVTTCEYNFVVASVARDVVAQNGYADRIKVLAKGSLDLQLGTDLDEPADLVFCDNFSDNFFSFKPLESLADARKRLLKPGAVSLPAAGGVRLAPAHWESYDRRLTATEAAGFDITPAAIFQNEFLYTELGDPGMHLLAQDQQAFRFDFNTCDYAASGTAVLEFVANRAGAFNGIAQWIRLELDEQTVLEARPEAGATFFSNPCFFPLREPLALQAGDRIRVSASYEGPLLAVWAERL